MKKTLLAAAAACSLILAAPAGAVVYVEGTGEPAFTNTTTNTQWVRWQGHSAYEQYRLEFDHYVNSVLVHKEVTQNVSPNGSGTLWVNWAGVVEPLQEGRTYTICGYGRYWIGGVGSTDTSSCSDAIDTNRRAATTIDRTKPAVAVKIDNGAAYSRTAKLDYHIDYSDNLAFPFPANFVCRDIGTDPASACATATHEYNEACSVPLGGMKKVTYFNCDEDLSVHPIADGPVTFCVVSADAAIPDNPNSSDQRASAASANLSNRTCDSITLDRAAPQVAVGASATSVLVGDLVGFTVQASDATSGLSGEYAWTWGDNTAAGAGESATHTFTVPGTYEVKVATADAAGNPATATKVITVSPRPATGDSGTPTNPGGGGTTTTPPPATSGGSGTVTAPPSGKQVSAAAGGGPTQQTSVAGLEVLAPKRLKLGRSRALAVALTAEGPGTAALALVRAGRVHAQGTAAIAAAGTVGYRLRLPRKLKAGAYRLKISFTPSGAARATTTTVKLAVTAARKKRERARASASTLGPVRVTGAPRALPTGRAPEMPRSRRVD